MFKTLWCSDGVLLRTVIKLLVNQSEVKWSEVRWTCSLPERQVDIRTLPNDDAERVAWLRGDSPSATSEEEVG